MDHLRFTDPDECQALDQALKRGDVQQIFTLLADYLTRNKLPLSDEVFRLYLERELFACLEGRGHMFDNI
ncbi:hypothetical protein [uncultured Tateyamaria sp.]|uniref:hypothetical protein n=1 Tax=uncultured Tateyamaria sp. TaxID=455651 RepID=UPI00261E29FB|nr:hypothetical protein [uncultured Tateyamaria sp.]